MKALQLVPAMEQGGVERYATVLNRILTDAGWENITISRGGRLEAELVRDGGRVLRLDLKSKNPLTALLRAQALRRILKRERPDVVCAHSRVPAWLFRLAARGLGIRWITFAHGANSVSRYSAVMVAGDRVMCPSSFVAAYLKKAYAVPASKVRVVPHAMDAERFDPARIDHAAVAALRSEWGLVPGAPVVMSIGRITRVKGLETLLDAFASVRVTQPTARLVIVGGADANKLDYLDSLRERVRLLGLGDAVVFAGSRNQIPECLSIADVVVASNTVKPESFGLVMVEALAMGRPVVAKAFGGALDIVRDGRDGVLVAGASPAEFAGAILRALELPRAALRADVLERFDYGIMCRDTLAVYEELTK